MHVIYTPHQNKKSSGFTIVELLIVIVVIAILAAISVVAYVGIQNSANDSAVQSDLSNMAKQVQMFHATESQYPTPAQFFGNSSSLNIDVSKMAYATNVYNLYYCTDSSSPRVHFGIAARSKSGQTFTISSEGGIKKSSSTPSWGTACGAFGESTSSNIMFDYGYILNSGVWKSTL